MKKFNEELFKQTLSMLDFVGDYVRTERPREIYKKQKLEVLAQAERYTERYKDMIVVTDKAKNPMYVHTDKILLSKARPAEKFMHRLFHEIAHSTGHPKRLNRPFFKDLETYGVIFSSKNASFLEECVAELSATIILNHLGFKLNPTNSLDYLCAWRASQKVQFKQWPLHKKRIEKEVRRVVQYVLHDFE